MNFESALTKKPILRQSPKNPPSAEKVEPLNTLLQPSVETPSDVEPNPALEA